MNLNIFSDLRKPGLVPGKNLSLSTKFDSVLEKNQTYMNFNDFIVYLLCIHALVKCYT